MLDLGAARALHDELPVFDLHADTPKLMHAVQYDVFARHARAPERLNYFGHVDVPRMREGGLAAQFFGMWTVPLPRAGCAASVHSQLDALDEAAARRPDDFVRCSTRADVERAKAQGQIAALAGIEGGHALEGRVENVETFARRGVRYLGLLHFSANDLGYPAKGLGRDDGQGLTAFGREVIGAMNRWGVILDLAHVNRTTLRELLPPNM